MKMFSRLSFGVIGAVQALALMLGCSMAEAGSEPGETHFTPAQRAYWAFQPVSHPAPPAVKDSGWTRNPIDAFVLAELEAKQLKPSPRADKITLLRRATLDLTGVPPTPTEVDAFLADCSAEAFDKVVDRLLASPRYGESWARHWLDVARYAESEGFKEDENRPNIWRYRDYVIKSLNADKPYDRFMREQIASDELWPNDPDALVATAFNRHYPDEHNARDLRQRRQEILNDITDTVGAAFLGMTYACARCHDHKFDPILQADYYRLQAFYANVAAADNIVLAPAEVARKNREQQGVWEEKTRGIREKMTALEEPKRNEIIKELVDKYPPEIQEAIAKSPATRSPFECLMYAKARQYLDPESYLFVAPISAVLGKFKASERKQWDALKTQLDQFNDLKPVSLPIGAAIADVSAEEPKTYLLNRGAYDKPKEEVQPGFLSILDPTAASIAPREGVASTGRRTALANWLADPQNPLTPRVMANRIWHYHFGRGIVATPSDFGVKGERPTNAPLLDWLTAQFVGHGWSIKQMHRLIMTSSAYQQASAYDAAAAKVDPDDKLLWRFPRRRLEGEMIRDEALAVAGLLNPKMGGPSIMPELPPGMTVRGGWKLNPEEAERDRASIYIFIKRNTRYPIFESFDMPDTHESCGRRNVTTTPLQALNLLNSELTLKWAQSFAGRVVSQAGSDPSAQIDAAYRLAFCRKPEQIEKDEIRGFLERQGGIIAERLAAGEKVALPRGSAVKLEPPKAAALVDLCHMLINANEFVYLN